MSEHIRSTKVNLSIVLLVALLHAQAMISQKAVIHRGWSTLEALQWLMALNTI